MTHREHVFALAEKLGVEVYTDAAPRLSEAGKMFGLPYVRVVPTLDRDFDYATALHELGHHAMGHTDTLWGVSGRLLHEEAEAWAWALHHATEVTDEFRESALQSLGSYFAVLSPDHPDYGYRSQSILIGGDGHRPSRLFWEVWGKVGGYVPTPEELSPAKEAVAA